MGFIERLTHQEAEPLAKAIHAKYMVVLEENGARIATYKARRDAYEDVQVGLPEYAGLPPSGNVRQTRTHRLKTGKLHHATMRFVGRLVGELPQSRCMPRQENEDERWRSEAVERMLSSVYYHSEAQVELQSAAWHASVLGAGCIRLEWRVGANFPYLKSVKPENVLPKFSGDGKEMEYLIYSAERSLASVAKQYRVDPAILQADRVEDGTGREFVQLLDYWDKERRVTSAGGRVLHQRQHNWGFIPFIIFRNVGPSEKRWGYSDSEFYEGLVSYYQTLVSQHADIIARFSNPPVLGRQINLTPEDLLKVFQTGGAVTSNKERASIEAITVSGAPPEFQAQAQRVEALLEQSTFAVNGASNLSGSALMELGVDFEALLALKKANWEASQKRMNEYILKLIEKLGSGKMRFDGVEHAGVRSRSFYMELDEEFQVPDEDTILNEASMNPEMSGLTPDEIISRYARQDLNYKTLIDQHYTTRIIWSNRTAKEDPQYQLALVNRFSQGALSLRTLLEELGVEDVEREVVRLKQENEDMPWLRPQVMAAQQQVGEGLAGGASGPVGQEHQPGASGTDVMNSAMNGSANGSGVRAGGVKGVPYGGQ